MKSQDSWLEYHDLAQGILPGCFSGGARGRDQAGTVVGPAQLCRHQQDLATQALQRDVLRVWGRAESPEPVDEVESQQDQVEGGLVGEEVGGRMLPRCSLL